MTVAKQYTLEECVIQPKSTRSGAADLDGMTFERLTVLGYAGSRHWFCQCTCGVIIKTATHNLKSGHCRSCGCLAREIHANRCRTVLSTHGMTDSPEYRAWTAMRSRCSSPTHKWFHRYGGRGISVCDRWLDSFENFYVDMGKRPEGKTLERRDNNGNYCPDNCYWATWEEQNSNRMGTRYVEWDGQTYNLVTFCQAFNLNHRKTYRRIVRMGYPLEQIIQRHQGEIL